ncbi:hypothetical protein J6590_007733 [Homalodisca vitripennis]|nr:hypothetical protein J6590_007733 [Homalodisca vitripennis]
MQVNTVIRHEMEFWVRRWNTMYAYKDLFPWQDNPHSVGTLTSYLDLALAPTDYRLQRQREIATNVLVRGEGVTVSESLSQLIKQITHLYYIQVANLQHTRLSTLFVHSTN